MRIFNVQSGLAYVRERRLLIKLTIRRVVRLAFLQFPSFFYTFFDPSFPVPLAQESAGADFLPCALLT